jgi:glutamate synthase (NADPH/NADH) small chain
MDAARSAVRLGAESVSIVYRRGRAELPACAADIKEAEHEGVRFAFLADPTAVLGDADGRARGLRCARMQLGPPDASRRPRPVPTGEHIEIEADLVILALGSRAEDWLADANPTLAVDDAARPVVSNDRRTTLPAVFAGGDLVRGAATVVEALGDGVRAAEAIDAALRDTAA